MSRLLLSVIIPTRDSARTLSAVLISASHHLVKDGISHEILVVDDCSTDTTVGIARKLSVIVPNLRVMTAATPIGYGANIRRGLMEAKGEWRLVLPAENNVSVEEFHKMQRYFAGGYDVIIGSRAVLYSEIKPELHIGAYFIRLVHNLLIRIFVLGGVRDTESGIFCLSENVARDVLPMCKINSAGGVVEIFALAKRFGYKIKETPIFWVNDGKFKFERYLASARDTLRWLWLIAHNSYNKK